MLAERVHRLNPVTIGKLSLRGDGEGLRRSDYCLKKGIGNAVLNGASACFVCF